MSYIQNLQVQISKLNISCIVDSDIKNEIIFTYRKRVLDQLKIILSSSLKLNTKGKLDQNLALKLQDFLKQNWTIIKGTLLSYTALQDRISSLLFEIAQDLVNFAKSQNQSITLLSILMPGLNVESLVPHVYPHLDCKSPEELMQLFKKSILGNAGEYCIPASLLLLLNESVPEEPLKNYYFDFEVHPPEAAFLNHYEMHKLIHQSPEAEEYYNSVTEYNKILAEDDSLYSRLKIMWKHLYYNSKNRAGSEKISGEGIYLNLINFMDYFDSLSEEIKATIPKDVMDELTMLKTVSSQPSEFKSCLATRQDVLHKVIHGNEEILKKIKASKTQHVTDLEQAKERMDKARENFKKTVVSEHYQSHDNLGLTYHLVKTLKITIDLKEKSLESFLAPLTPDEITSFCNDDEMKKQIVSSIKDIESLVLLITTRLSYPQLERFITGIQDQLINEKEEERIIRNIPDLFAILVFLNEKQLNIVLDRLHDRLLHVIHFSFSIGDILCRFEENRFKIICSAFLPHLSNIIKSVRDFRPLFLFLNDSQHTLLYKEWKPFFVEMINNSATFKEIMWFLNKSERTKLYEEFKNKFPVFFETARDLGYIIKFLNPTQKLEVYQSLKDHLLEKIQKTVDVGHMLEFFVKAENEDTYLPLKTKIFSFIQTANDYNQAAKATSSFKQKVLYSLFKERFPQLIHSAKDFNLILEHTPLKFCKELYETTRENFSQFIQSAEDFNLILALLEPAQRSEVYDSFKDSLPELVQTSNQLELILDVVDSQQVSEICQALRNNFSQIIPSSEHFFRLIKSFSASTRTLIYKEFEKKIPDVISSTGDLCKVLLPLNEVECHSLCQNLKLKWPVILGSSSQLMRVLKPLNEKKRFYVCQALINYLPNIIKSNDDLLALIQKFGGEQRLLICNLLGQDFSHLISSTLEFAKVFNLFPSKDWGVVYRKFNLSLNNFMYSPEELGKFLTNLEDDNYTLVCKVFKDQAPLVIKTKQDLNSFLNELSKVQRNIFHQEYKELIYSINNLPEKKKEKPFSSLNIEKSISKICKEKTISPFNNETSFPALFFGKENIPSAPRKANRHPSSPKEKNFG